MFSKKITGAALAVVAALAIVPSAASAHWDGDRGGWDNHDRGDDHERRGDDYDRGGYYGDYSGQDYYASQGYYAQGGYGYDGYYAQPQRTYYRHERYRCSDGTAGTVIGAVFGGLLGNGLSGRGDHALGTILGGGAGALAGRAIDRSSNDC